MQHTKNIVDEKAIVRELFLPLSLNSNFAIGLQDDCANIFGENDILISTDSMVQGWHLHFDVPWRFFGHKLLARNLSDIASKGGVPIAYTLSIFLPNQYRFSDLEDFASGLHLLTEQYNCPLIGGDISFSGSQSFLSNITIYGRKTCKIPYRKSAKSGDKIYVTGKIGLGYLGYLGVKEFEKFYLEPLPQIELGKKYAPIANAMIDVSDGFFKDLKLITPNAEIFEGKIPVPQSNIKIDLDFGDDYQLLFTSDCEILTDDVTFVGFVK